MRDTSLPRRALPLAVALAVLPLAMGTPAFAQKMRDTSPSITVMDDPATTAMRRALDRISPDLGAAARWQGLEQNGDGSMVADDLTIDVPWQESQLTIRKISLTGDQVSLEGVRLENGKGVLTADGITGPTGAFRALAAFAFSIDGTVKQAGKSSSHEATATNAGSLSGSLKLTGFTISAKQRQGDAGHFMSAWKGDSLAIDGLHCATGSKGTAPCEKLGLDGLTANTVEADATFAGTARLDAAMISLTSSGSTIADWQSSKALAKPFSRRLDEEGPAVGAEVTVKDMHLVASRVRDATPADTPSRIDVGDAHLSLSRGASGSLHLTGNLSSAISPNVFKDTSLWPAINQGAEAGANGGLLPLTAHIDANYDGGKLALDALTANIGGLFDLNASTRMSGLTPLLDHGKAKEASGGSTASLGKLIGVTVSSLSLVMHDKGLSQLIQTAFQATPAELLRQAAGVSKSDQSKEKAGSADLMSLVMGGGDIKAGLKSIVKQAAVDRGAAMLEQLQKTGKVELHCSSTPQCLTLAITD